MPASDLDERRRHHGARSGKACQAKDANVATSLEFPATVLDTLLFINGELRPAAGGRTYDNITPWTGEVIGQAADASEQDVSEAIGAARHAFDTTDWSTNHAKRLELVTKLYDLFAANTDRLIQIARDEAGLTIFIANTCRSSRRWQATRT